MSDSSFARNPDQPPVSHVLIVPVSLGRVHRRPGGAHRAKHWHHLSSMPIANAFISRDRQNACDVVV